MRIARTALVHLAAALALWLAAATPVTTAAAYDRERHHDYSTFYDDLGRYGFWTDHPVYGYVWVPDGIDASWRPYTVGHWAFTDDYGWYWVSDEPFGWATYHYGRWAFDEDFGWIWIPGHDWGPAWVAWRESDDVVGWAPLPPDADWFDDSGLSFDTDFYDRPGFELYWCFVHPRHLFEREMFRHIEPVDRNASIIRHTRIIGTFDVSRHGDVRTLFDAGPRREIVERHLHHPLPVVALTVAGTAAAALALRRHDGQGGGTVGVFRPQITAMPSGRPAPPPPRIKTIAPGTAPAQGFHRDSPQFERKGLPGGPPPSGSTTSPPARALATPPPPSAPSNAPHVPTPPGAAHVPPSTAVTVPHTPPPSPPPTTAVKPATIPPGPAGHGAPPPPKVDPKAKDQHDKGHHPPDPNEKHQ